MELTHTRLLVDNYEECYYFYKDILGFESTWGDETSNYAQFRVGNTLLALFERKQMLDDIGEVHESSHSNFHEVVLIFRVENVDNMYEGLKSKVTFVNKPHSRADWGIRVAHFRDPSGTLIEINENI